VRPLKQRRHAISHASKTWRFHRDESECYSAFHNRCQFGYRAPILTTSPSNVGTVRTNGSVG
jgi:hypothetical protein